MDGFHGSKSKTNIFNALNRLSHQKGRQEDVSGILFQTSFLPHIPKMEERAVAVISATILEQHLEQAIKTHLVNDNAVTDRLFGAGQESPLSNLGAKIKLARALDIIDDRMYHDLEIVRRVRNVFAHSAATVSFSDQAIMDACDIMIIPGLPRPPPGSVSIWPPNGAREKYAWVIAAFCEYVIMAPKPVRYKSAYGYDLIYSGWPPAPQPWPQTP